IGARALLGTGGQHLPLARPFEVAVKLLLDRHPAKRRILRRTGQRERIDLDVEVAFRVLHLRLLSGWPVRARRSVAFSRQAGTPSAVRRIRRRQQFAGWSLIATARKAAAKRRNRWGSSWKAYGDHFSC